MTESRTQIVSAIQAEIDADDEYTTELNTLLDETSRELEVTLADRARLANLLDAAQIAFIDDTTPDAKVPETAPYSRTPAPAPAPVQPKPASPPTNPKKVNKGGRPKMDLAAAATVYNQAVNTGASPIAALATYFGVPNSTARNWPPKLRAAGLIPPVGASTQQQPNPNPPGRPVGYECGSCAYTVESEPGADSAARTELRTHVRSEHDRSPSTFEMVCGVLG